MKQEVTPNGLIRLTEVYNPVIFQTEKGNYLSVMMRDEGYDCIYNGRFFSLKDDRSTIPINNLPEAMGIFTDALKEDESFKLAWSANIAMAFKDEFDSWKEHLKVELPYYLDIHRIANNAAENFLDMLIKPTEEDNYDKDDDNADVCNCTLDDNGQCLESLDELNDDGKRRPEEEVNKELETTNVYKGAPESWNEKKFINKEEFVEEHPLTQEEEVEKELTTDNVEYGDRINYVHVGEAVPFKNTVEPELLRGIALGTYYASGRQNYQSANMFAAEFERMLGAMTELDDIYNRLAEFDQDFRFSEEELNKMTEYCGNNIQEIWASNEREKVQEKDPEPEHDMYIHESRLWDGIIVYRYNNRLFFEGALNPLKNFNQDSETEGDYAVDFSHLKETTDKYNHIMYRYENGEFVEIDKDAEKQASREAGEKKQDDSPGELPDWFERIDLGKVDELSEFLKNIEKYKGYYEDVPLAEEKHPCANCSEYIRAQRIGGTLICNCTIPYMTPTSPFYIGTNTGYSNGSSSINIGRPAGSSSISFVYNGNTAK